MINKALGVIHVLVFLSFDINSDLNWYQSGIDQGHVKKLFGSWLGRPKRYKVAPRVFDPHTRECYRVRVCWLKSKF